MSAIQSRRQHARELLYRLMLIWNVVGQPNVLFWQNGIITSTHGSIIRCIVCCTIMCALEKGAQMFIYGSYIYILKITFACSQICVHVVGLKYTLLSKSL